ncbi:hypothetical protein BJX99DRAFT_142321 [Aspergillus californicus]
MDDHSPKRVVLYANVTDIPGNPQRRFITLAEAFCKNVLDRDFYPIVQPFSYDHVHIPGDYDSNQPLKRWFIIDLDVKEELATEIVAQLPHLVYLASYKDSEWNFILREKWTQQAISRAGLYTWGGRQEQREVAKMRGIEADGQLVAL